MMEVAKALDPKIATAIEPRIAAARAQAVPAAHGTPIIPNSTATILSELMSTWGSLINVGMPANRGSSFPDTGLKKRSFCIINLNKILFH